MFGVPVMQLAVVLALSKAELQTVVALALVILAFSMFGVALAWGGVFVSLFGWALLSKEDRKQTGEVSGQTAKDGRGGRTAKGSLRGTIPIFMIVGGLALAAFDLWRNGRAVGKDAEAYLKTGFNALKPEGDDKKQAADRIENHRRKEADRDQHMDKLRSAVKEIHTAAERRARSNPDKAKEQFFAAIAKATDQVNSAADARKCVSDIYGAIEPYVEAVKGNVGSAVEKGDDTVRFARESAQTIDMLLLAVNMSELDLAIAKAAMPAVDAKDPDWPHHMAVGLLAVIVLLILVFGGKAVFWIVSRLDSRAPSESPPAPKTARKTNRKPKVK